MEVSAGARDVDEIPGPLSPEQAKAKEIRKRRVSWEPREEYPASAQRSPLSVGQTSHHAQVQTPHTPRDKCPATPGSRITHWERLHFCALQIPETLWGNGTNSS